MSGSTPVGRLPTLDASRGSFQSHRESGSAATVRLTHRLTAPCQYCRRDHTSQWLQIGAWDRILLLFVQLAAQ
jgi:hypothetical protein